MFVQGFILLENDFNSISKCGYCTLVGFFFNYKKLSSL